MRRGNSRHAIRFKLKNAGDGKMEARTNMNVAAGGLALIGVLRLSAGPGGRAASAPAKVDSLDELDIKAKKEAGKLNVYASLSAHSL